MPEHRRDLLHLAWPATLAMIVHHLFRLNDQYFVQELGVEAHAAVGVGGMVAIFFIAFGEMVGVGNLAISARRLGEGNHERAFATMRRALRLSMAIGAGVGLLTVAALPWLCDLLIQGDGDVARERAYAADYLFWIAIGQVLMAVVPSIDSSFLAMKDARTPLVLQILAVTSNATLNWLLVPHFEVEGVAISTVISRALVVCIGAFVLYRRGVGTLLTPSGQGARIPQILRIGVPACISIAIYSAVYLVLLWGPLGQFGPAARSAVGVGFGIETIFYCLYWGVGSAVASLVGRYLGEGSPQKALSVSLLAIRVNAVIGFATAIVFVLFGTPIVRMLAEAPGAIEENVRYLNYMAVAQPFQALQVAFEHAIIGAGMTFPVMVGSVTMNVLRIPLAWGLTGFVTLGIGGVWWAVNISSIGKCVWMLILHRKRRWLHQQV
ncbi:MAG: MATE family efflux transporter [Planctomycetota bacterium]